jgi:hypothetical protein
MSPKRTPEADAGARPAVDPAAVVPAPTRMTPPTPGSHAREATAPRSREEAETQYIAVRNAWTLAMHRASSGRSADLASLAIAQQAYEEAVAERERWETGNRLAIPIEPDPRTSVEVIVGQDLAWQRVHEAEQRRRPGVLSRLARRIKGRG